MLLLIMLILITKNCKSVGLKLCCFFMQNWQGTWWHSRFSYGTYASFLHLEPVPVQNQFLIPNLTNVCYLTFYIKNIHVLVLTNALL